jgi:hypothetical protein
MGADAHIGSPSTSRQGCNATATKNQAAWLQGRKSLFAFFSEKTQESSFLKERSKEF